MKPYSEQVEAAKIGAKAGKGIIVMPTGCGKSVTMALLINELQVKTLVIVPNLELKRQLKDSFTRWFGSLDNITVENIDSGSLKTHTDYGCIIIDEAHHSAAATYRKLNKTAWKGIFYRFFFTATPMRSRDEETLLMESVTGRIIYRVHYQSAVDAGYIAPLEGYFYKLPKTSVTAASWAAAYSEGVVNNEPRNRIISDLLANLDSSGVSTLCLVKEIRHGEILSELTGIPFASGINEDTKDLIRQFNNREIHCLIGTTGVLGEGIDTKPCEYVIIAGLGKSKNAFMQQVGRSFRKYPGKESAKVILFRDSSNKWFLAHFRAQVKHLLDEYGVVPVEL